MIEHKNTQWFYYKRRSYHNFRICSITYKNLWLIYRQLMEIIKMESFLPLPLEYWHSLTTSFLKHQNSNKFFKYIYHHYSTAIWFTVSRNYLFQLRVHPNSFYLFQHFMFSFSICIHLQWSIHEFINSIIALRVVTSSPLAGEPIKMNGCVRLVLSGLC